MLMQQRQHVCLVGSMVQEELPGQSTIGKSSRRQKRIIVSRCFSSSVGLIRGRVRRANTRGGFSRFLSRVLGCALRDKTVADSSMAIRMRILIIDSCLFNFDYTRYKV